MQVDIIVIICVTLAGLGFIAFVGIFAAIFHRKLGTVKKGEGQDREELSETQHLAPTVLSDETEIQYTTSNVQPPTLSTSAGYPHDEAGLLTASPMVHDEETYSDDSAEEIQDESDDPGVTPTLSILLRYDRQRNYLLLKLLKMFDLPHRRDKTEVNSLIEVRLFPNFGQNPIQTDVYMNSNHPTLDETFEFEVDSDELKLQKIEFVILDSREFSNRYIGYATLSLDSLNMYELMSEKEINTVLTIGKPIVKKSSSLSSLSSDMDSGEELMTSAMSMAEGLNSEEISMQPRMTKATVRLTKDWEYVAGMEPMILLSLNYEKQAAKLYLAIVKVSNLKMLPNNKKPDTYVKVHIYAGKKLKLKKKTHIAKEELNPIYNQKLDFHVSEKELANVKVELSIKNLPARGKPRSINKISLGNSSTGSCLEHWQSAISSTKPITKWHVLN